MSLGADGELAIRIYSPTHNEPALLTVILFHGLTGSANSSYMQSLGQDLLKLNYRVVLVNHRNCGEGMGLARGPYHSGCSPDVSAVISYVRQILPAQKIVAFGVSMSANAILDLLSLQPHLAKPDFAIVVNPPIHLERTTSLIQNGPSRLYEKRFVWRIPDFMQAHLVDGGGHVGFIQKYKTELGTRRWLNYAVTQYLHQIADSFSSSSRLLSNPKISQEIR